ANGGSYVACRRGMLLSWVSAAAARGCDCAAAWSCSLLSGSCCDVRGAGYLVVMMAEPGWCGVCGLAVPAGERLCRWPFGGRAGDGQDHGAPGGSHSLAFMTELVELQHW